MEGAAFYRVVAEFPAIRVPLVKEVSDYTDPDKSAFQATIHDDAQDAFMTLPPYARTRENEAH